MKPEDSLPCSQVLAIGPYPEPDACSPHLTNKQTPYSRVLLEEAIVTQLVKDLHVFYRIRSINIWYDYKWCERLHKFIGKNRSHNL
jgi:hypothetical protein